MSKLVHKKSKKIFILTVVNQNRQKTVIFRMLKNCFLTLNTHNQTYSKSYFFRETALTKQNTALKNRINYSPFGVQLQGRNFTLNGIKDYRYGLQSQEEDDEIRGDGNGVNFKYRMYDPRLGRFFAIDPLAYQYPHNSPYAFSENRVIDARELEGLEMFEVNKDYTSGGGSVSILVTAKYVHGTASQEILYSYNGGPKVSQPNWKPNSLEADFDTPGGKWDTKTWGNPTWARTESTGGRPGSPTQVGQLRTHREAKTSRNTYYNASTTDEPVIQQWQASYWPQDYNKFQVNYATDESITLDNVSDEVRGAVAGLVLFPELRLNIVGNTSHLGTSEYNQSLSSDRALESYNLFMDQARSMLTPEEFESIQSRVTHSGQGETNATGPDNESDLPQDRNTSFEFTFTP